MESTPANAVHMAVYDTLTDWEVGFATAHINGGAWLREPGTHCVVTVGESTGSVTSTGGMQITPHMALADLRPSDSAMLILPGADTWLTGGNRAFSAKAREFLDSGVPVAAICGATVGLAEESLLDDRDHTSDAAALLEATGYRGESRYRDVLAVTDGRLVTASSRAAVEFAREVFALLGLYEPPVLASWYKMYGHKDPAGYYELVATQA